MDSEKKTPASEDIQSTSSKRHEPESRFSRKKLAVLATIFLTAFAVTKFTSSSEPSVKFKDYSVLHRERNEECDRQQVSRTASLDLGSEISSYERMVLKARHAFKNRAKRGVVIAQYCLATYYQGLSQRGNFEHYELMVKWYRRAADRGDMLAQYSLGLVYSSDFYKREDEVEAFKWYSRAAEKGDARAQFKLGRFYSEGTFEDVVEATRLLKDRFDTKKFLNEMEEYKSKVESAKLDYKKARKWYRRAALQGDIDAQFKLASLYQFGQGGKIDIGQARIWYRLAAENGNAAAQYALDRLK